MLKKMFILLRKEKNMKFTVLGFSSKIAKELQIDYIDLFILRWFTDFKNTGKMIYKVEDGVKYYWVDYSKFFEDYDLLSIKKDAVYKRFRKMCEKDILKRMSINHRGTCSYFAFSKNYDLLVNYKVDYADCQSEKKDFNQEKYEDKSSYVDYPNEIIDMNSDNYLDNYVSDDDCLDNDASNGDCLDNEVDNHAENFYEGNCIYELREIRGREVEEASTPLEMFQSEDDEIIEEPVKEQIKADMNHKICKEQIKVNNQLIDQKPKIVDGNQKIIDRNQKLTEKNPEQIINPLYKSTKIKNPSVETLDEYRLGEFLYQSILRNNPQAKKPNFDKWAKTFGLMIRVDHRRADEIVDMIKWVHMPNNFWNSVILSPSSLRKYYDRLVLKRKLEDAAFAKRVDLSNPNYNNMGYETFD